MRNVLTEALELMNERKLKKVELRILKQEAALESFFIDISANISQDCDALVDEFRESILTLESRCKLFQKVSQDCKFKVLLHTTSNVAYNESRSHVSCNDLIRTQINFNFLRTSSGNETTKRIPQAPSRSSQSPWTPTPSRFMSSSSLKTRDE